VVIPADEARARLAELASLLVDSVDGGGANGFLRPLAPNAATAYWEARVDDLVAGRSILLGALGEDDELVGIVVVDLAGQPNGQHRAEVTKLIVRSDARRQGLGSRLLAEAEQTALARGRWLLVLDTVPGSDADRLYRRHGWNEVGLVPDFALLPDGEPAPTTIFYKRLA
jgi:GNAT superfamily N-acetyltransferase